MKKFKDSKGNLYVDPIEANYSDLVELTDAEFDAILVEKNTPSPEEALAALRSARDTKLAETDYLGLSDVTMPAKVKTYRQALRDITATYQSLDTVVWPVKP